jgi:hypothetical protein
MPASIPNTNTSLMIRVIDEIAFQTNLFALNAAVEAGGEGQARSTVVESSAQARLYGFLGHIRRLLGESGFAGTPLEPSLSAGGTTPAVPAADSRVPRRERRA